VNRQHGKGSRRPTIGRIRLGELRACSASCAQAGNRRNGGHAIRQPAADHGRHASPAGHRRHVDAPCIDTTAFHCMIDRIGDEANIIARVARSGVATDERHSRNVPIVSLAAVRARLLDAAIR